jgi:signal transduction histidine kinase
MGTGTIRFFAMWGCLVLWCTHAFSQATTDTPLLRNHAMVSYGFDRIFSGKEVRKVGLDKQGFLWFTIPPATIMRWNGRESRVIDRLADGRPIPQELISFPQRDLTERPVWCNPSKRNQWMQVDDDGKLRIYKVDSSKLAEMAWTYWGNSAVWVTPTSWNKLTMEQRRFQHELIDEWRSRYRFFVDSTRVYVLDTANVYYYQDTLVRTLPGRLGWKAASGCLVGKYWLAIQDNRFQLFDQNRLIDAGALPPSLQSPKLGTASLVWDAQFLGDTTVAGVNDRVVRLFVQGGRLNAVTLVRLPASQSYSSIFWHAAAEKLLVIPSRGGFVVYEPKLFEAQAVETDSELLCYSVVAGPNQQLVTNLDFRNSVDWQSPVRFTFAEQSAIRWNPKRSEYYYAHHNFLYVLDARRQVKRRFPISGGVNYSMHLTDSALYFHTSDLYEYRFRDETVQTILQQGSSGMDLVYYLYPIAAHTLIVAKGNYVGTFDLLRNQWKPLHANPLLHIRSVWFDARQQRIWVTTNGYGIYILDPTQRGQEAIKMPLLVYPAVQFTHYVLQDSDGDYWLPTNRGLYSLPSEQFVQWLGGKQPTLAVRYFGKPQGLENDEFNGGFSSSGFIQNDSLFLASMGGIVSASAKALKARQAEMRRQVLLDRILVNDELLPEKDLLHIDPDYRKLVIVVDYSYIEHPTAELHYRIRGGMDTAWYTVPADGEIRLPNFRPGNYTLEIVSTDEPGGNEVLELPLRIKQYWYLRWWAWAIYILVIACLTYIGLRWSFTRREYKATQRLSAFRKQLLSWVGHDLRSPVVSHRTMTHMLVQAADQQKWDAVKQMSQFLYNSSNAMELLIQNLVQWGKSDLRELTLTPEPIELDPLLNSLKELYRFHAEINGIRVEFPAETKAHLVTDSNLLQLILRNVIDNAIKNSERGTTVRFDWHTVGSSVAFSVTNQTKDPDDALLERINTWLRNPSVTDTDEDIAGFGLGMVAIRTALYYLGGKATLAWNADSVTVEIFVPQAIET